MGTLAERGALIIGDGYRTKRDELAGSGFRILRVADVLDGRVEAGGPDFVAESFRPQIGAKAAQDGDVLVTTKGTVGRVAMMPALAEEVVYSPQLCFFRVTDRDVVDPRFLSYWFASEAFREQASHRANNTDMAAYINLADIRSLEVDLPAVRTQRAIAEVLGALDDKIAANAALISRADDLAEQKFLAMTMNDNTSRPLSSLAQFVNGKAFTKGATGTGRVVIRIAELNSGLGNSTVYHDLDVSEKYLARPGDLLFAWSGSLTVQRWFHDEGIINQHIFKVIPTDVPKWVVNGSLRAKLAEFKGIAADKATTMGHIQRHHLDEAVLVPNDEAIASSTSAMQSLWDRALQAERESLKLAELRDTLLPELVSGRFRVKNAEQQIKEGV